MVMFLEILHTLLRVLMIFSILIVAFGLAFYILLSDVSCSLSLSVSMVWLSFLFAGGVPAKFFIFFRCTLMFCPHCNVVFTPLDSLHFFLLPLTLATIILHSLIYQEYYCFSLRYCYTQTDLGITTMMRRWCWRSSGSKS